VDTGGMRPWRHDQFVVALPPGHPLAEDAGKPVNCPASPTSPGS